MGRSQSQVSFAVCGSPCQRVDDRLATRGGGKSRWWHDKAALAFDFQRSQARIADVQTSLASQLGVLRASEARYPDASGSYQMFAENELVQLSGVGAFVGSDFTNKIRNPRGEGGTAGVTGLTNLLSFPTSFENAAWIKRVKTMVIANQGVAPDGSLSADLISVAAGGGMASSSIYQTKSGLSLTSTYRCEVFVKRAPSNPASHIRLTTTNIAAWSSGVSTKMALTDEWQLLGLTHNTKGAETAIGIEIGADKADGSIDPDCVGNALIWRAALIAGSDHFGSLPAKWLNQESRGLALEFLDAGEEDRLPYVELRYRGTATSTGAIQLQFDASANAAAADGEAWGHDLVIKAAGGSQIAVRNAIYGFAGAALVNTVAMSSAVTPGSARQRLLAKGLVSSIAVDCVKAFLEADVSNGVAYDFSIRLYAPKLCRIADAAGEAGYLPSYPIVPPALTQQDSTRDADEVRTADFSWHDSAGLGTGAVELLVVEFSHVGDGVERCLFEYSDGTTDNLIGAYVNADDKPFVAIIAGGESQAVALLDAPVANGRKGFAFGWAASGGFIVDDCGHAVTFGAVTLPVVTQKRIGGGLSGAFLNDRILQMQSCRAMGLAAAATWAQSG